MTLAKVAVLVERGQSTGLARGRTAEQYGAADLSAAIGRELGLTVSLVEGKLAELDLAGLNSILLYLDDEAGAIERLTRGGAHGVRARGCAARAPDGTP